MPYAQASGLLTGTLETRRNTACLAETKRAKHGTTRQTSDPTPTANPSASDKYFLKASVDFLKQAAKGIHVFCAVFKSTQLRCGIMWHLCSHSDLDSRQGWAGRIASMNDIADKIRSDKSLHARNAKSRPPLNIDGEVYKSASMNDIADKIRSDKSLHSRNAKSRPPLNIDGEVYKSVFDGPGPQYLRGLYPRPPEFVLEVCGSHCCENTLTCYLEEWVILKVI